MLEQRWNSLAFIRILQERNAVPALLAAALIFDLPGKHLSMVTRTNGKHTGYPRLTKSPSFLADALRSIERGNRQHVCILVLRQDMCSSTAQRGRQPSTLTAALGPHATCIMHA